MWSFEDILRWFLKHWMTKEKWNGGGYTMWMMRKRQCTWTKLWNWIEDGGSGVKRKKWDKWQKKLKNHVFQFRMNMRKIHTIVQNETEMILATAQKMKSENRFRMTMRKFRTVMRNALGRQKWCWWTFHFAQSCEIVGAHAK